jgi:hypothetical protein
LLREHLVLARRSPAELISPDEKFNASLFSLFQITKKQGPRKEKKGKTNRLKRRASSAVTATASILPTAVRAHSYTTWQLMGREISIHLEKRSY